MTAIQLYKFINETDVEWHWDYNENKRDVLILPTYSQIENFCKLLDSVYFVDGGVDITLMNGYFAIWMGDICSGFGIELSEVFGKDDNK